MRSRSSKDSYCSRRPCRTTWTLLPRCSIRRSHLERCRTTISPPCSANSDNEKELSTTSSVAAQFLWHRHFPCLLGMPYVCTAKLFYINTLAIANLRHYNIPLSQPLP